MILCKISQNVCCYIRFFFFAYIAYPIFSSGLVHTFVFLRDLNGKEVKDQQIQSLDISYPALSDRFDNVRKQCGDVLDKCKNAQKTQPDRKRFEFEILSFIDQSNFLFTNHKTLEKLKLCIIMEDKSSMTPKEKKTYLTHRVSNIIKNMCLKESKVVDDVKFKVLFIAKK